MILLIDNYDSFTYNLYQAVAVEHTDVCVVRSDAITLEEIQQLHPDGIILSPGPGRPETAGICISLIRAIRDNILPQIPLLGVCLGHQAIVCAFNGHVIQAPEIVHGKSDFIYHHHSTLFQTLPQPFAAGRYHSLIAEKSTLPKELKITAYNSHKDIMGIQHKTLPIFGVQFHPESILTPDGQLLIKQFLTVCVSNG